MKTIDTYTRPAFLGDHPPVLARMILASMAAATAVLAGSVLGRDSTGKLVPWTKDCASVEGVLAGDVTVPASGDANADVYIHASVVAEELIFADGVSADDKRTALAALREKGIYSSVTWAPETKKSETPETQTPETQTPGE